MAKWVRLWGKKRGSRMSGWWVVGSVSEAAFYGVLFLLGIVSLTIVVSWQVFWPDSSILRPGFGFWLMVIASTSLIVIGLTAFVLQISQTLASPEMRSAMASKVKSEHMRRSDGVGGAERISNLNLPSLQALTDSPGVKLAYRLPVQRGESTPLILSALFTLAWNAMTAVLGVLSVQRIFNGTISLFLTILLVFFVTVAVFATRWFFQLLRRQSGIGPTAIEIDVLPLLPGGEYELYLCQYGRVVFERLALSLVAYEETTYQQGTDVRTEVRESTRIPICMGDETQDSQGIAGGRKGRGAAGYPKASTGGAADLEPETHSDEAVQREESTGELADSMPDKDADEDNSGKMASKLVAEPEKPLEMDCTLRLPVDMMHSFQSEHSAVVWKIVVEGDSAKWPEFCRSFPVAVYPRSAL